MKTIYKYIVTGLPLQNKIEMPKGASILSVNMQGADCCMWALVDTESETEEREFEIVGTGWELDDKLSYVGTCFAKDGFVWHIVEVV
jgi:hypothetical protein